MKFILTPYLTRISESIRYRRLVFLLAEALLLASLALSSSV